MNKKEITGLLRDCWLHILLVIFGLILLVNPDGATALVTKLLGWGLVIGGAINLHRLATGSGFRWDSTAFLSIAVIGAGVFLLAKPLILANLIGRVLGVVILIEGLRNLKQSGKVLAAVTIVAGVVLILMPRTLTQTVFAICGIVMMVIGVVNILGRLRNMKYLHDGSVPNIIDAEN